MSELISKIHESNSNKKEALLSEVVFKICLTWEDILYASGETIKEAFDSLSYEEQRSLVDNYIRSIQMGFDAGLTETCMEVASLAADEFSEEIINKAVE